MSLALVIGTALGISVGAQETNRQASARNVVKAWAQTGHGSGQDSNIHADSKANPPDAKTPPPPEKSATPGARTCSVEVNNYTTWFVDIYIDAGYAATVGPWGNGEVYPPATGSKFYARANFTDGSWKFWGPQPFTCAQSGASEWRLNP